MLSEIESGQSMDVKVDAHPKVYGLVDVKMDGIDSILLNTIEQHRISKAVTDINKQ